MEEQKSFKERVRDTVIYNASSYKRYYVDYEYLLCSKAFVRNRYYIVSAYEDNYLHLTGLHTNLSASLFFEKAYRGTLVEADFDFCKNGQSESEVKGSVRRKINSLSGIMHMFTVGTLVEEDFEKNRIRCSLAAGNSVATLGFVVAGNARPMTLLKGNELNAAKAKKLDIVLARKVGKKRFSELILGSKESFAMYKDCLQGLITEELQTKMED